MVQMSTIWDRTVAFASTALASIMPIAVLLLFLPISIQLAITPVLEKQAVAARLIPMILFWVVQLLGTLSIIVLALGATLRPGDATRAALARLLPAIGVFVVLGILIGLAAVPLGIGMRMAGIDMAALRSGHPDATSMTPGIALLMVLYALVYIVLILWATARLLVIEPVILAERRGIGAIKRAFGLTRGLTWRIIGVLLLYAIVSTIAVLAAQTVFGSILRLIAPDDGDIGVAGVITAIIVAAVSAGFKVLAAIFVAKLYVGIGEAAERVAEPL